MVAGTPKCQSRRGRLSASRRWHGGQAAGSRGKVGEARRGRGGGAGAAMPMGMSAGVP